MGNATKEVMQGIAWVIDQLGIKGAEVFETPYQYRAISVSANKIMMHIFFNTEEDMNLLRLTLDLDPSHFKLALKDNSDYFLLNLMRGEFKP